MNSLLIKLTKEKNKQFLNILLVDDNPFNIDALETYFDDYLSFFRIKSVFSGESAIELCEDQDNLFDIIFMDVNMPGLDGFQTSKRIRKIYSRSNLNKTLYICYISANDTSSIPKINQLNEFYISKPIDTY